MAQHKGVVVELTFTKGTILKEKAVEFIYSTIGFLGEDITVKEICKLAFEGADECKYNLSRFWNNGNCPFSLERLTLDQVDNNYGDVWMDKKVIKNVKLTDKLSAHLDLTKEQGRIDWNGGGCPKIKLRFV